MVYKRYIKRDGKIFGPYYYESYRDEQGIPRIKKVNAPEKPPLNLKLITIWFFIFLILGILILNSNSLFKKNYQKNTQLTYNVIENKVYLKSPHSNLFISAKKNIASFFIPTIGNIVQDISTDTSSDNSQETTDSSPAQETDSNSETSPTIDSNSLDNSNTIQEESPITSEESQEYTETTNTEIPQEIIDSNQEEIQPIIETPSQTNNQEDSSQNNSDTNQEEDNSSEIIETSSNDTNFPLNNTNITLSNNTYINLSNNSIPENNTNITEINYTNTSIENKTIINVTNQTDFNNTIIPQEENISLNETNISNLNSTNITFYQNITINVSEMIKEQYEAILGKPVKWRKQIQIETGNESLDKLNLELLEATNISVKKINKETGEKEELKTKIKNEKEIKDSESKLEKEFFNKVMNFFLPLTGYVIQKNQNTLVEINEPLQNQDIIEIEYYTEPPKSYEKIINNKKSILISGPEKVHYKNILAYTELPKEIKDKNEIRFYWVEGNKNINFKVYDFDSNGLFDHASWIVPHLSNQTYEIIPITNAIHLDSNRNFIEDIYDLVKTKDNNFTSAIPANDYIRVSFEKNLTSQNDITIYAKSNLQNASIEVYEKNKNTILAKFEQISNYSKYKILLINLNETQDTFDLKITNGPIEFDYIVDPFSGGGSGTLADPYNITNCTQLQEIKNNLTAVYQLVNNIDCSNTTNWNSGAGFEPLGNSSTKFSGTFIGNYYNINDLYIYRPTTNYVGLFGYTQTANISNVSLININITGQQITGTLIGYAFTSTDISNIYTSGIVNSTSTNVGGIIGSIYQSKIFNSTNTVDVYGKKVGGITGYISGGGGIFSYINKSQNLGNVYSYLDNAGGIVGESGSFSYIFKSYSTGNISGVSKIGGLVGSESAGEIQDSYAKGNATGTGTRVGGLTGQALAGSLVNRTYSIGVPNGAGSVGGLIGLNSASCLNSFWDNETSGTSTSACGTELTTQQMYNKTRYENAGWNFCIGALGGTWAINDGYSYPCLEREQPFCGCIYVGLNITEPLIASSLALNDNFNLTSNVTAFEASTACNVSISFSDNSVLNVSSGWNLTESLGNMAKNQSNLTTWNITAIGLGSSDITSTVVCNEGSYTDSIGTFSVFPSLSAVSNITKCEELQYMSFNLSGNYTMNNNIDCINTSNSSHWLYHSGSGFEPIGNSTSPFNGTFNGQGYNITNLFINRATTDYIGLFGYSNNSNISNLGITNSNITGKSYVGSIIGKSENTSLNNLKLYFSKINGTLNSVGGIIGEIRDLIVSNTFNYNSSITAGGSGIGGLSGAAYNSNITNYLSYNSNLSEGGNYMGGAIGTAQTGTNISNLTINNPKIYFNGNYVGGVIGYSSGKLISQINSIGGSITGTSLRTGGLIGYMTNNLSNATTTTIVSGSGYVGGLIGYMSSGSNLTNSYATKNVSATASYAGGLIGYAEANTLIQNGSASGNVTLSGSQGGGLIGYSLGNIINSSASGNVKGAMMIGGFAGQSNGNIDNSLARGDVNATTQIASGFSGYVFSGTINNSYSTGDSYAPNYVSGFAAALGTGNVDRSYTTGNAILTGAGPFEGGFISVTFGGGCSNSFWNNETSNQTTDSCAGGTSANLTQEMKTKTTYNSTWGFCNDASTPWAINTTTNYNSYPCLDWEYSYCGCPGITTTEICDGIDNDYDSQIDENLGQTTCGVGACEVTTDNCIGGVSQTCTPGTPTTEICDDDIDNDCDGLVDENCNTHHGPQQIKQFTVSPNYISLTLNPGDSGSRQFRITNTGTAPLNLIINLAGPHNLITLTPTLVSLNPQESEIVSINFDIPEQTHIGNYGWLATIQEESQQTTITGQVISGNPVLSNTNTYDNQQTGPVTTINLNPLPSANINPVSNPENPLVTINILLNVVSPNPMQEEDQGNENPVVEEVKNIIKSLAGSAKGFLDKIKGKKEKDIKQMKRGIAVLVLWIFIILLLILYLTVKKIVKIQNQLQGYKTREEKIAEINKMKRESLRKKNIFEKSIDLLALSIVRKSIKKEKIPKKHKIKHKSNKTIHHKKNTKKKTKHYKTKKHPKKK